MKMPALSHDVFSRRMFSAWLLTVLLVTVGAVAAEAAPFAYVTNNNSNSVSVIDTARNVVVATVTVDVHPVGVAITPF